jgi:hypothetical protein
MNTVEHVPYVATSPETHRYVGMWRPPFDTIFTTENKLGRYQYSMCPCGIGLANPELCSPAIRHQSWEDAHKHWLAGHFDVPQYELKGMSSEQIRQLVEESRKTRRCVWLVLPDTPLARANEQQFDKLEQLLSDPSPGAVKMREEIADFIQFGRLYLLTIEDMGTIE